jgi:hypothetical protein
VGNLGMAYWPVESDRRIRIYGMIPL